MTHIVKSNYFASIFINYCMYSILLCAINALCPKTNFPTMPNMLRLLFSCSLLALTTLVTAQTCC